MRPLENWTFYDIVKHIEILQYAQFMPFAVYLLLLRILTWMMAFFKSVCSIWATDTHILYRLTTLFYFFYLSTKLPNYIWLPLSATLPWWLGSGEYATLWFPLWLQGKSKYLVDIVGCTRLWRKNLRVDRNWWSKTSFCALSQLDTDTLAVEES